jgi:hypothetical protein
MPVLRSFRARQHRQLPAAWAIPMPSPEVVQRLQWHGIEFRAVEAASVVTAERFAVTGKKKPKRPYQGHQELLLEGSWQAPAEVTLPLGTIVVSGRQRRCCSNRRARTRCRRGTSSRPPPTRTTRCCA